MLAQRLLSILPGVLGLLGVGFFAQSCAMIPHAPKPKVVATITVAAGDFARIDTPVSIALGVTSYSLTGSNWRLEEVVGDSQRAAVPAQIDEGDSPRLWWLLSGITQPGDKRFFELSAGTATVATPGVEIAHDGAAFEARVGGGDVLRYNHALVPPPEGQDPLYARSGFFHPLWAPDGQVLTRIHPPDHYHHLGLWNPWTDTTFEGRHVDFWNLKSGQGTVRFKEYEQTSAGPVFGGFRAKLEHVDLSAPGGEKVALNETINVKVWNVGGKERGYYLWDFTTTQRCASSSPLKIEKYRYGGLGFRATEKWHDENSNYLSSEGKTREDGHGTRARWCEVYGTTDKGLAGIVFMSHPHNRAHPEPMRIWPPKTGSDQGNVFFNFCPVQDEEWLLEPGKDYTLTYRMCAYSGTEMTPEMAERFWQDFGNPPLVEIKMR